jgi:hypothetical protein
VIPVSLSKRTSALGGSKVVEFAGAHRDAVTAKPSIS